MLKRQRQETPAVLGLPAEAALAGGAAFALYLATLQRGLSLPDSAVILEAMRRPVLSAFACNHTLNNLCGWLIIRLAPFGSPAWRGNLVAACYGAAAATLFYALVRRLGSSKPLAAVCTASMAVSHGVWWHATVVENYLLSAVLFLACGLLLTSAEPATDHAWPRRRRFALGFLAGLALLNHLQNGLLLAGCLLAPGRRGWRRGQAPALSGALLGLAPYLGLAVWETAGGRAGAAPLAWLLGGGGFGAAMFRHAMGGGVWELARLLVWNHPGPFLAAVIGGLAWTLTPCRMVSSLRPGGTPYPWFHLFASDNVRDKVGLSPSSTAPQGQLTDWTLTRPAERFRPLWRLAWVVIAGNALFFAGYATWDRFSFFLAVWVAADVAAAGWLAACERRRPVVVRRLVVPLLALGVAAAPLFYAWQTRRLAEGRTGWLTRPWLPVAEAYRGRYDLAGMLLDPVRRDRGTIEVFLRRALASVPPGAVWVDDGSTYDQILWLQRREGLRPDVEALLLTHPLIPWRGADAHALAMRCQWEATPRRWFIVADQGVGAAFIAYLRPFGWRTRAFHAGGGTWLTELVRGSTAQAQPKIGYSRGGF